MLLPREFLGLVRRRDHLALAVLAHYCVLVYWADGRLFGVAAWGYWGGREVMFAPNGRFGHWTQRGRVSNTLVQRIGRQGRRRMRRMADVAMSIVRYEVFADRHW